MARARTIRKRGRGPVSKPRSLAQIERDWDAEEDARLDLAAVQGSAPQADRIDAVLRFLEYFDFECGNASLMNPVPNEVLEQLADCFNQFVSGGATLDKAFGGKTGRAQQRMKSSRKAEEVTALVMRKYWAALQQRRRSPRSPQRGSPMEIAMESAARKLGKSIDYVRKQYKASRLSRRKASR